MKGILANSEIYIWGSKNKVKWTSNRQLGSRSRKCGEECPSHSCQIFTIWKELEFLTRGPEGLRDYDGESRAQVIVKALNEYRSS